MTLKMQDGQIVLGNIGPYYNTIKSWGLMTYHKPTQTLRGSASIELLDNLAALGKLPSDLETERRRLRAIKDAVDAERNNPAPVPFVKYPVKVKLFAHQLRGANMCMLTFGVVDPRKRGTT